MLLSRRGNKELHFKLLVRIYITITSAIIGLIGDRCTSIWSTNNFYGIVATKVFAIIRAISAKNIKSYGKSSTLICMSGPSPYIGYYIINLSICYIRISTDLDAGACWACFGYNPLGNVYFIIAADINPHFIRTCIST